MNLDDLNYELPKELIALSPQRPSRILLSKNLQIEEINKQKLFELFSKGDVLVINNTQVLKRRIFFHNLEILFLGLSSKHQTPKIWEVLFPAKKFALGEWIDLPNGLKMKMLEKGRPQIVELSEIVDEKYFDQFAQLPLPPYIQELRPTRENIKEDDVWYQTAWAKMQGSLAAPTASLHFEQSDLEVLRLKGVQVLEITLHVGLGTFLPIKTHDLDQHQMHSEQVSIQESVWKKIELAKLAGNKIFALGTTVTRTLESFALYMSQSTKVKDISSGQQNEINPLIGKSLLTQKENNQFGFLKKTKTEDTYYQGETRLFIQPGFEFKIVDVLLTNFHQPQSTLLALVYAFYGKSPVQQAYQFAITNRFRFLSYGDLSVWLRSKS